jgi:hypothetical protein
VCGGGDHTWLRLANMFILVRDLVKRSIPSFVPKRSVIIFCSSSYRRCLCSLNSGHSDRASLDCCTAWARYVFWDVEIPVIFAYVGVSNLHLH